MFGLPGGSPGPNAQASWTIFFIGVTTALIVAGSLFWIIIHIDSQL